MVRVTSQGSEQEKSAAVQIRQGQQRNRNRMQDRYRAQDKHNTKAESASLAIPLNTPVSSVPGVSWLKG
ncbi:unnamed protein product [Staurois parvus]|uniref:BZIP domain-containing protein n=2 Tax=Staurois parvus TaxID=386267 RepID=A0ABN9DVS3_9NEOB|nr:unnamed protein product [Staurois parvus]